MYYFGTDQNRFERVSTVPKYIIQYNTDIIQQPIQICKEEKGALHTLLLHIKKALGTTVFRCWENTYMCVCTPSMYLIQTSLTMTMTYVHETFSVEN